MKRKICTLFLAALAVFSLTVPASADMIIEPRDSFYEKHRGSAPMWLGTMSWRGTTAR